MLSEKGLLSISFLQEISEVVLLSLWLFADAVWELFVKVTSFFLVKLVTSAFLSPFEEVFSIIDGSFVTRRGKYLLWLNLASFTDIVRTFFFSKKFSHWLRVASSGQQ